MVLQALHILVLHVLFNSTRVLSASAPLFFGQFSMLTDSSMKPSLQSFQISEVMTPHSYFVAKFCTFLLVILRVRVWSNIVRISAPVLSSV
jgi:hypothetical protein